MEPSDSAIIVVSGLPRSGTSLMMQMLAAGGVEPVTDRLREADDDNPRGYFEMELVKKLKEDAAWVAGARGKAVKVVSQLLTDLPVGETYRVVFMERDLDEVLASQEKMIVRRGGKAAPRDKMKLAFKNHLDKIREWLGKQPNFTALWLSYPEVVERPRDAATQVAEFLGRELDASAMAAAVDPALYRNKGA